MIPKIFHWAWVGPKTMPAACRGYIDSWRRVHPGWEEHFWTDANLPPLATGTLMRDILGYNCKTDILRYELMAKYGGIWLDVDVECVRSIEPLLDRDIIINRHPTVRSPLGVMTPYLSNHVLGSVPGHPFFVDLLPLLPNYIKANPRDTIAQTGPGCLLEYWQKHKPETPIIEDTHVFSPFTSDENPSTRYPETIGAHHWMGTWYHLWGPA